MENVAAAPFHHQHEAVQSSSSSSIVFSPPEYTSIQRFDPTSLLQQAKSILEESSFVLSGTVSELQRAKEVVSVMGLKIDSYIIERPKVIPLVDGDPTSGSTVLPTTTGGFSNTDHIIRRSDDSTSDRIAEWKRNLLRRDRQMQPENRKDERWDKPKVPGERRRKIVSEKDQDDSPPEPPHTGWSLFVSQMTTKIRHDEPNVHHDQSKVLVKIGNLWKSTLTDEERNYYNTFAEEAKKEYQQQVIEYRATGSYRPSQRFRPLENTNIWVRTDHPCRLELEIQSYQTVRFRPRPPELDDAFEERQIISLIKRKLREKGLLDKTTGNPKHAVNLEQLVQEERNRRRQRRNGKSPNCQQQQNQHHPTTQKKRKMNHSTQDSIDSERAETTHHSSHNNNNNNYEEDDNNDDDSVYDKDDNNNNNDNDGENDDDDDDEKSVSSTSSTGCRIVTASTTRKVKVTAPQSASDLKRNPLLQKTVEIYRGPPTTKPSRVGITAWPEGWIQIVKQRKGGNKNRQWLSPGQKLLHTLAQVQKYMQLLTKTNNDEDKANDLFRTWKSSQQTSKRKRNQQQEQHDDDNNNNNNDSDDSPSTTTTTTTTTKKNNGGGASKSTRNRNSRSVRSKTTRGERTTNTRTQSDPIPDAPSNEDGIPPHHHHVVSTTTIINEESSMSVVSPRNKATISSNESTTTTTTTIPSMPTTSSPNSSSSGKNRNYAEV